MPAAVGRQVDFYWGGASVLGVREKGVELNGEPINTTSDEDDGRRTLLNVSAEDEVNITVSGVTKDTRLKTDWFAGNRMKQLSIGYPDGNEITGQFYLASYSDTGPYNDAVTFEASFQSNGQVTYLPYA